MRQHGEAHRMVPESGVHFRVRCLRGREKAMSASAGSTQPRIVIAGGGLAGLSLALALKTALADGIDVIMCDPALKRDPHGDKRSYAIAAAARRMLEALGVWT